MAPLGRLSFEPLGDQAVLVRAGDETAALAFAAAVRRTKPPWVDDVVQAYTTVAVFYRPGAIDYDGARTALAGIDWSALAEVSPGKLHVIPCCYELGLDFDRITAHTGLTREQIIAAHTAATYTVYAIGFCPGFPYLGYLPEALQGVPRLESPRLRLEAGSVGLTGRQTGIYTEARPGGWNIVGRTPLQLVDVADNYFPISTGDRVRFEAIDRSTFERWRGRRL
ncbi:MAG: allophanate hydrolase subunit 1 [Gemmataceae bacterium]|nr:allophanate hydrolase subunit 1 [Gemmataceae bacterium]